MNLRVTHQGYPYQDLITGIALVDLALGTAVLATVDTKGFPGDWFDDLKIADRSGRRVRIQIKHTTQDRELAKATFSADGRTSNSTSSSTRYCTTSRKNLEPPTASSCATAPPTRTSPKS